MKHIAIDIRSLGETHFSGIHYYTYNILNELALLEKDNNIYYLFFNSAKARPKLPDSVHKNSRFILATFSYPNKILNLCLGLKLPLYLDKIIEKKYSTKIDAFWFPNIAFYNISPGCRLITTIHDMSYAINPKFFSKKRQLWHTFIRPLSMIKDSNHLLAVSNNTKNDLLSLCNILESKITITPLAADLDNIEMTVPIDRLKLIKEKYFLPSKFILFLGTFEPRKNITSIIKAFNHITSDHYLVLCGKLGWKYQRIFNEIKKSPKSSKIKVISTLENSDKKALYALADIFIFPSFYEGFGMPAYEAHATNIPIITSLNNSIGEHVKNRALFIDPYNISHLVAALNLTLTQRSALSHLQEKKKHPPHQWRETAKKTLSVLNSEY